MNEIQKPHKQTRKAQTRKFLFYVLFLMYLILDFVAFQNELLIRTSSISKKTDSEIHVTVTFFNNHEFVALGWQSAFGRR